MKSYSIFFLLITSSLLFLTSCTSQKEQEAAIEKAITANQNMENQRKEELKALVQKFYDQLSNPNDPNTDAVSKTYMAEGWKSTPQPLGGPNRTGFVTTLGIFGGMIPDLNWDVQEMLVEGNKVTVRSIATGTPNAPGGEFFGVPTYGKKSFEIMTIDVHEVIDGKMAIGWHVEDWATAMQQVSGQEQ